MDHCRSFVEDPRDKTFLPANEAYRDGTRRALDSKLLFGITSVLKTRPRPRGRARPAAPVLEQRHGDANKAQPPMDEKPPIPSWRG